MNVVFHSDWLGAKAGYGLGRYATEMWDALSARDPAVQLTSFSLRGGALRNGRRRWQGQAVIASWAALGLPRLESWIPGADIVHSVDLDYPVATRCPWIATVHDLGPLTHPQFFSASRPWLKRSAIRKAAERASVIVCVSSATAEAVERTIGRNLGDRLRVVPEGVGQEFFTAQSRDCLLPLDDLPPADVPYFLWTGSMNPRKNVGNVIKAFDYVASEIPHRLVLAGGLGWNHDGELQVLRNSRFRRRIHHAGRVTDEQLRALYQGADGFVFVSLMEGFGLPILEAMASRCPVITSNVSSMPEVAGDAALLVDPQCHREIGEAMHRLASDESLRREYAARGETRARQFSWDRCAGAMLQIYREAV